MGYKIYFSNFEQIKTFIVYAQDLLEWGCRSFRLSNSSGAVLNLDTTNYGSNAVGDNVRFGNVVDYIDQYYNQNGQRPITMEIKLKCPEGFRAEMDRNNYFQAFYITFYSSGKNHYMNLGYSENGNNLLKEPYTTFAGYVQKLYDEWKKYYANEYES